MSQGQKAASGKILILFDLDDTLTPKGSRMQDFMYDKLAELKAKGEFILAVLTTTGETNMMNQLVTEGDRDARPLFDYLLAENGLVGFKVEGGTPVKIHSKSISDVIAPELKDEFFAIAQMLINTLVEKIGASLQTIAQGEEGKDNGIPDIATFLSSGQDPRQVLLKVAMFNFTPIGTNKNRVGYPAYRAAFKELNKENVILESLRVQLETEWNKLGAPGLEFTVGGSTGVDASPPSWNKSYGYRFMKDYVKPSPSKIYFFGDNAIKPTGNDFKVCRAVMAQECPFCCFKIGNPVDTSNYLTLLINGYNPEELVEGTNMPINEAEIHRQLCDTFKMAGLALPDECTGEGKGGGKKRRKTRKRRKKRKTRKRHKKRRKKKTRKRRKPKKRHRRTRRR